LFFFFSSRRRHTRFSRDWSSDVCSSDLTEINLVKLRAAFGVVAPEEESGSLFDKPSEIAELIKRSSEEEITANAAKLRELLGSTATPTRVSAADRTPAGKAEALALNGDPLTQSLKAALGL